MNFVEYQKFLSPTTFQEDPIDKFEEILGLEKDDVDKGANNAILAGFTNTAPLDALNSLGNNFNIDRPPPLTDLQWRMKLAKQWEFWQTSGTPARLISEIKDYGFPNVSIIPEYVETSPGNFMKSLPINDQNPAMDIASGGWWSNFWVIIDQPHPFVARKWGSPQAGKWGLGDTVYGQYKWGSVYGDPSILANLKKLIKKLKPAWTSCRGIIFLFAGAHLWGDGHSWGDGTLWGFPPGTYLVERIVEEWES